MGSALIRLAPLGLASVLAFLGTPGVRSQGMLAGCRLENGSLQCVPGMTADPQQQIQVLDGEISSGLQAEGRIQQTISDLQRFVLVGEARQGQLLKAELMLNGGSISAVHIHWYRRQGNGAWILVQDVSESTYTIGPDDAGSSVMAVLTVTDQNGNVSRVNSNTIGPVRVN